MSSTTAPWPPESGVSLRFIKDSLFRGASVIAVCGLIPVLAALGYLSVVPPSYMASTEILIDPRGLKAIQNDLTPRSENNESAIALLESQIRIVRSESVLRGVIGRLNLERDPEFVGERGVFSPLRDLIASSPTENARTRALRALQRAVQVDRASRSYVIVVNAFSEDPGKAAQIADTIAAVYLDEEVRARADSARRVGRSMTSRLQELADNVRDSERNVEQFKQQNNIVGSGKRLVNDQQLEELTTQLTLARSVTNEQKGRVDQIERLMRAEADPDTIAEAIQSPTVSALRAQFAELVRQEASASALLGDRHPEIAVLRQRRKQHQQLITDELKRTAAAARNDYARAVANENALAANLETMKSKVQFSGSAMVRLRELERVVEANRAIYEASLVRTKELNEQEGIDTSNTRVIAEALPPNRPTTPRRALVLAALVGGLIAGASLVLLRRYRRPAAAFRYE
jgi:succinoglycan biosynthesis transport protein ExoP